MRKLVFLGKYSKGIGRYSELVFPSLGQLQVAPLDWPSQLHPGSFNVEISPTGYPEGFEELGDLPGIKRMDQGQFLPEFIIPHHQILKNKLSPSPDLPNRGDAQIWRATLGPNKPEVEIPIWMVRRIGSGLQVHIELVSAECLSELFGLVHGDEVRVTIYEGNAAG